MKGCHKERSPLPRRPDCSQHTDSKRQVCLIFLPQSDRLTVSLQDFADTS